ncbi:hypothetical protein G3N55_10020 [Dissulfurirhabdus thermomarina]|uniref:DUF4410 domain-containing protein n=1 Tax=Dissulfurirhabdus thermomarina TaxID=1765737 RepID=A0A6N9TPH9_DISTH|nr:hypothetical protein [Dissulfurirhabdus thermomarina]NDY43175.1 hypothetical protein [Dissulfurirhabdus thermomarina]NMX22793.1 hypothetical protein [Dissulfurirhabdus thermomarina]
MTRKSFGILTGVWLCLALAACGQSVSESVTHIRTGNDLTVEPTHHVVLLPLADYAEGITLDDSMRRQVKVHDAIAHRLARHGILSPVPEDVVQYLVDLGVIRVLESATHASANRVIARELNKGWSPEMKEEIRKQIALNAAGNESGRLEMAKVGLDRETIQDIGQRFGADYVLRGRIVEYEVREGHSFDPLKRGLLPFTFDLSSTTLFGVAESEDYDLWQQMAVGAIAGAVAGGASSVETPYADVPGAGNNDHHGKNAAFWGGTGASVAYLAAKGGKIPKGVVQLSLALQDVRTGRVVWANRVEKQVIPRSAWADPADRAQVDRAVEEAAATLADDLAAALAKTPKMAMKPAAMETLPTMPMVEPEEVPEVAPPPEPAVESWKGVEMTDE